MAPDGHATGSGTLISSSNKLQLGGMALTGRALGTWAQGGGADRPLGGADQGFTTVLGSSSGGSQLYIREQNGMTQY